MRSVIGCLPSVGEPHVTPCPHRNPTTGDPEVSDGSREPVLPLELGLRFRNAEGTVE